MSLSISSDVLLVHYKLTFWTVVSVGSHYGLCQELEDITRLRMRNKRCDYQNTRRIEAKTLQKLIDYKTTYIYRRNDVHCNTNKSTQRVYLYL